MRNSILLDDRLERPSMCFTVEAFVDCQVLPLEAPRSTRSTFDEAIVASDSFDWIRSVSDIYIFAPGLYRLQDVHSVLILEAEVSCSGSSAASPYLPEVVQRAGAQKCY